MVNLLGGISGGDLDPVGGICGGDTLLFDRSVFYGRVVEKRRWQP